MPFLQTDTSVQCAVKRLAGCIVFCPVNVVKRLIVGIQTDGVEQLVRLQAEKILCTDIQRVAGNEGAYGNAEKTVPVRTPLMVLPTLPRVLGQGEDVTLPVNVFAMEKGVADVTVSVKAEGPAKISGTDRTSIRFDGTGDTIVRFGLKTSEMEEGTAKVTVTATGGGYTASETVSVQVRNPNPPVTTLQAEEIAPGESREFAWQPSDGCSVNVGLAGFPSIDFNGSFSYLSEYQHSCTEQISAKGIALLSMKKLLSSENAAHPSAA